MGAAKSSNVSNAVTNVSNFVNNSTSANNDAVSTISNNIKLSNCYVQLADNFNINETATLTQTCNQIVTASQDANLQNNIQQQMLQEATSKVGFLGIGYASASNSSNEMVNSSTTITNSMQTSASDFSSQNQSFVCDRSTIIADNLNIGFYATSGYLSNQTVNNAQTAKIINKISQSVTQKATATVQGISGLLFALLLLIAVIIYAISKPLSSGAGKVAVGVGLIFGMTAIVIAMYIKNTPPFFSEPSNCINNSAIGMGDAKCINLKHQKLNLESPPIKYLYPLLPNSTSTTGGNLLQIAISAVSGQSKANTAPNGGYNIQTCLNFQNKLNSSVYSSLATKLGITVPPNPLTIPASASSNDNTYPPNNSYYYLIPDEYLPNPNGQGGKCTPGIVSVGYDDSEPSEIVCFNATTGGKIYFSAFNGTNDPNLGIANFNLEQWKSYLQNNDDGKQNVKASFARFVLCDIIGGIDLHYWFDSSEIIKFIDSNNNMVCDSALDSNGNIKYPNDTYRYFPLQAPSDLTGEFQGGGYLEGFVGVLNDREYKFEQFMKKIGWIIIVGIIGITFGYMAFTHITNKSSGETAKEEGGMLSGLKDKFKSFFK